jgi:hypothetical protein
LKIWMRIKIPNSDYMLCTVTATQLGFEGWFRDWTSSSKTVATSCLHPPVRFLISTVFLLFPLHLPMFLYIKRCKA